MALISSLQTQSLGLQRPCRYLTPCLLCAANSFQRGSETFTFALGFVQRKSEILWTAVRREVGGTEPRSGKQSQLHLFVCTQCRRLNLGLPALASLVWHKRQTVCWTLHIWKKVPLCFPLTVLLYLSVELANSLNPVCETKVCMWESSSSSALREWCSWRGKGVCKGTVWGSLADCVQYNLSSYTLPPSSHLLFRDSGCLSVCK